MTKKRERQTLAKTVFNKKKVDFNKKLDVWYKDFVKGKSIFIPLIGKLLTALCV